MLKKRYLLVGLLMVGLLGAGSAASAAILSLSSTADLSGSFNEITVAPATQFTFYAIAHDFSLAELATAVFGYEFRVNFGDPNFLINSVLLTGPAPINVGTQENLIVGTGGGVAPVSPLVLVRFTATYVGAPLLNHQITLGPTTPSSFNPPSTGWLDISGALHTFSSTTSLTVNPTGEMVPEPATLTLLGIGFVSAGVARWRKRKA